MDAETRLYDQEYINYRTIDAAERIGRSLDILRPLLGRDRLFFGPTFHLQNSRQDSISVDALIARTILSGQRINSTYFLIAQGSDGRVLGVRKTTIENQTAQAQDAGEVVALPATTGIASVLELVNLFVVQNEVSIRGRKIVFRVDPANTRRLEQIRERIHSVNTQEGIKWFELYQRKLEEDSRWQKLFGDRGMLGFTGLEKSFFPVPNPLQLDQISDIHIAREDIIDANNRKMIIPRVVSTSPVIDPVLDQTRKKHKFISSLLPQLEELASHKHDEWMMD